VCRERKVLAGRGVRVAREKFREQEVFVSREKSLSRAGARVHARQPAFPAEPCGYPVVLNGTYKCPAVLNVTSKYSGCS